MTGQQLVLKYQDGSIMKGWVDNFNPNKEIFFLHPLKEYSEKEKIDVKLKDLKAVFFVKDFVGDSDYQEIRAFKGYQGNMPTEQLLIVYFKDGERLYGTTYSYNPTKIGFFVYPIDHKDNNIRIFVILDATKKVEFPDNRIDSNNVQHPILKSRY